MPLLIGGFLASVLLMKATGSATAVGRMATLVIYAFVGALLTDLIAGPLIGAYPDSQFWILWPIFALIVAAVAMVAAVLERALGALGTVLVVILFIVLGGPSSGGGGIPLLPPFWHAIGPYLPPQNAVVLIRNTLYFDGNGTTHAYITLGIYVLIGVAFGAYFNWLRPRKPPEGAPAPGHAARRPGRSRVVPLVGALLVVAVMQCLFTANYTSAERNPVAYNLPFGEMGSSPLTAQVQKQMSLKTIQYPSQSALNTAFNQNKIYGALVSSSGTNTLVLNGAASAYAGYPLTMILRERRNAAEGDPQGQDHQRPALWRPVRRDPGAGLDRAPDRRIYIVDGADERDRDLDGPVARRAPVRLRGRRGTAAGPHLRSVRLGMADPPVLAAVADHDPHRPGRRPSRPVLQKLLGAIGTL